MISPEVLVNENRVLAERRVMREKESVIFAPGQTRMTINVLSTMAITFVFAVAVLLVLAGSSINEAIAGGGVAMGAAFINLVRRPPHED